MPSESSSSEVPCICGDVYFRHVRADPKDKDTHCNHPGCGCTAYAPKRTVEDVPLPAEPERKKCVYGEHPFDPFQGPRNEPGKPHCLTCGHVWGECSWHWGDEVPPPHDFVSPEHCDCCAKAFEDQTKGVGTIPRPQAQEPPLTPEEEEEAPVCMDECGSCEVCGTEPFELPPQPLRRPPYAVAYSVGGHLYEVALPGDATVQAVDGALIIQHALGPVAGITRVLPIESKEAS